MSERLSTSDLAGQNASPPPEEMPPPSQAVGASTATGDANAEGDGGATAGNAPTGGPASEPLLAGDESGAFQERWRDIQAEFVDEPRHAVERADNLVAELMRRLAETFAEERDRLEEAWSAGDDVGTEDLRVALQRYRSFFQRLLST